MQVKDLGVGAIWTWRNHHRRDWSLRAGEHREQRVGRLGKSGAILGPEREDEQMESFLLPVIGRAQLGHPGADCSVHARSLERNQQPGVGTRKILAHLVLAADVPMVVGRTGRTFPSMATWHGGSDSG